MEYFKSKEINQRPGRPVQRFIHTLLKNLSSPHTKIALAIAGEMLFYVLGGLALLLLIWPLFHFFDI